MTFANLGEPFGDQGERVVPFDRLPLRALPAHRSAQAVGIVLDILQRHGLGADMAPAERIERIALDREDALDFGLDGQAADGFAQVAGTVMDGRLAHFGFPHDAVVVPPL